MGSSRRLASIALVRCTSGDCARLCDRLDFAAIHNGSVTV